ncbi:MAG: C40 family peptidase [Hyphomicrobiaceae bacterium]|nr:C40 family peptidase [Hyphomicrobiaceae bacterium]
MTAYDPRLTPARADLAAAHLKGRVDAPRFVIGATKRITRPTADLKRHPAETAPVETQALCGETVTIYDESADGWAWGQLNRDGYVGWLAASALGAPGPAPTHKVAATRTFVFSGPSIKTPIRHWLSLGSPLAIARTIEAGGRAFAVMPDGGHLVTTHIAPLDARAGDPVAVAEGFLETPYLWGGRSSLGTDCSGLVQTALNACGIDCPRDSDMQEAALGTPVSLDPAEWCRGDLLFWPGHVAFVRDAATMLHANAHHMKVAIEPLGAGLARIAAAGANLRAVRRP